MLQHGWTLKKINADQKEYCMIPLVWDSCVSQIHRYRKLSGDCQEPMGERNEELLFKGYTEF